MRSKAALLALCTLAALSAGGTPKQSLHDLVAAWAKRGDFGGVVLVTNGEHVLFNEAFGLADLEAGAPVTKATKFYIASLSKGFTAYAILQLRDAGKLSLDDPLSRFDPTFPDASNITIRQLLNHQSGLSQNTTSPKYFELATKAYSTEEAVDTFRDAPRAAAPGTRRIYANPNYTLLALVIERASGMSYGRYMASSVFAPLRLSNTAHHESWRAIVPGRAKGYEVVGSTALENARYYDYSIGTGAGSLYSTAGDLWKWLQFVVTRDEVSNYVLGSGPNGTLTASGWDGAGFSSHIIYDPAHELFVIVLANRNVASISQEVAGAAHATFARESVTLPMPDFKSLTVAQAHELAGKYQLGPDFYVPNTVLDIVAEGAALLERQGDGKMVGLIRIGENEYLHRSSWGRIVFTGDGLTFYGRFQAKRVS